MMSLNKSWPSDTVVRTEKFSGKTFIKNVEVVFNPIEQKYVPVEKKTFLPGKYVEYDLRTT